MGRVKLKIRRLDGSTNRQTTFSKRKHGIMKKAEELSILCDVDILLLMFSPSGKPLLFHGQRRFDEIVARFAQVTPQEREKRKLETLDVLKKTFRKIDHDVNVNHFLEGNNQRLEELTNHALMLQAQLAELNRRLSFWSDPEKIENVEHLRQMENSLTGSLQQIQLCKDNFGKQEFNSLGCPHNQFQDGTHVPMMMMPAVQEAQQVMWHSSHTVSQQMQQLLLSEDTNTFISPREMECSGESSFPGYCGTSGQGELDGATRSVDFCHHHFATQLPYFPYGNLGFVDDGRQGNTGNYQAGGGGSCGGGFEMQIPIDETGFHLGIPPTTAETMINATLHPQQQQ